MVDTNIFVGAAFNPRSSSARIVQLIEDGSIALVWNDATLRETEKIVRKIPPISWENIAPLFREANKCVVRTHEERFRHIEDPDDRKFAALAHACDAVLISNDAHLLSQRANMEIDVMKPSEFLRTRTASS